MVRLLFAACLASLAMAQEPAPDVLGRVAKEAELLARKIPAAVSRETLEQRRVRAIGSPVENADNQPAELHLTRTIVSEYTVAPLQDSPSKELVEFRQVTAVNGHAAQSAESARHALSQGVLSPGESARKRMLEDFARYGLVDAATDYALVLLAFTSAGQENLKILPAGEDLIGTDDALAFAWTQSAPGGGELSFDAKQSSRQPLTGKLWARKSDGLPLRVSVWAVRTVNGHAIRDEATIDYVASGHGFVAPASVLHHHVVDGQLRTENLYRYGPFTIAGADGDRPSQPPK
jgi:hypothetical protein